MIIEERVIGDCRLILGDAIKVIPMLKNNFDALVTDPPYGLGKAKGTLSIKNKHKRDYDVFDDTEDYLKSVSVPIVEMSLKLCAVGIITPGAAHCFEYPKPDVMGAFYQPATLGMCSWGRQTQQPILYYGKDPHAGKTIQHTSKVLTEKPSTKEHPCAKPMQAWSWIVLRASRERQHVFDPFMGSGTTGVACVNLGRKFTGIELSREHYETSVRRIIQAYEQPSMFDVSLPKKIKNMKLL